MNRWLSALLLCALTAAPAAAHFIWIVPDGKAPSRAQVVFSDDLSPDDAVEVEKIAATKLSLRDSAGKVTSLAWKKGEHAYLLTLPGRGPCVVGGACSYGVISRGKGKPFLLAYHPKFVRGQTADAKAWDKLALDIVPQGAGQFRVLFGGKPAVGAEVVVLPAAGAAKETLTTDARGEVKSRATGAGVVGLRARHIERKKGEHGGKKYEEVRHYATLVFQPQAAPGKTGKAGATLAPLPTAVSSLGAIRCDGYLYVYGGHAGKTHRYDTKGVIGTFHRLKLEAGSKWENLPGGPILQGMNLAAHGGKVYRVGGMQPRNKPGDPADNHSLANASRFDPKSGKWEVLPPLPAGESPSHDLVVAGNKLVVVGGWQMRGRGEKSVWHDTALILDLTAKDLRWQAVPQPFKRRALTATAVGPKVYVIGGLGTERTAGRVEVLDVETLKWSRGPDLPATGGRAMAFSPASGTVGGRVVVNTSAGPLYRLTANGAGWEKVGEAARPRMVARLVPLGPGLVALVGGASRGANVAEVEVVKLAEVGEKVTLER